MLEFKITITGVSLLVRIEYSVNIGEVEVEQVEVYDGFDTFRFNNLAPVLADDVLKQICQRFYDELPDAPDYGEGD